MSRLKLCEKCGELGDRTTRYCVTCAPEVADELRAELAKVTKERDEATTSLLRANLDSIPFQIIELRAEIRRLNLFEDWVIEFGQHTKLCFDQLNVPNDCDCGLDALLKQKDAK